MFKISRVKVIISCAALISGQAFSTMANAAGYLSPASFGNMYALAQNGNVEALRASVRRGLNIDVMDYNGDTGLCIAARRGDIRAYNSFRAAGANPYHRCTLNIPNYSYFTGSYDDVPTESTSRYSYRGKPKSSFNKWWLVGGAVAVGAGVAVAAGGGGGGGGSSNGPAKTVINNKDLYFNGNDLTGINTDKDHISKPSGSITMDGNNNTAINTNKGDVSNNSDINLTGNNDTGINDNLGNIGNDGNINIDGDNGKGIDSGSGNVDNNGDINIDGNNGTGIENDSGTVDNDGNIKITGDDGTGIDNGNGKVDNGGDIDIEGDNGKGIDSDKGDVNNEKDADITITGDDGTGIGSGDGNVDNDGNITVIGDGGKGIDTEKGDVENDGKIIVNGDNGTGIESDSGDVKNNGDVDVTGKGGKGIDSGDGDVNNDGNVTVTGDGGKGIDSGDGDVDNGKDGKVIVDGNNGTGIESDDGKVTNEGTVVVSGDGGKGIDSGEGDVDNQGTVVVEGNNGTGIETDSGDVTNDGDIGVIGNGGKGIDSGDGDVDNNGTVTIDGDGGTGIETDSGNITNDGEVTIIGDGGKGIDSGSGDITNNGEVNIDGDGGTAIDSDSGTITNHGEINLDGNDNTGIHNTDGEIINDGKIDITGNNNTGIDNENGNTDNEGDVKIEGDGNKGIHSGSGDIDNEGDITIDGDNGTGIESDSGDIDNKGDINLEGNGNTGIHNTDGKITNDGPVDITGNNNTGIESENGDIVNTENGDITMTGNGNTGIDSETGDIDNKGDVVISGDGGKAIDSGSGDVDNKGNVTIEGKNGTGIESDDGDVNNDGQIVITGDGGKGIDNGEGDVTNKGDIIINGNNSTGIESDGGNVDNDANITMNGDNDKGIDTGSGDVDNDGNITITGNNGTGIETDSGEIDNDGDITINGDGGKGIVVTGNTTHIINDGTITVGDEGDGIVVNGGVGSDTDGDGAVTIKDFTADANEDGIYSYYGNGAPDKDFNVDGKFSEEDYTFSNTKDITIGRSKISNRNYNIYVGGAVNLHNTGDLKAETEDVKGIQYVTGIYAGSGFIFNDGNIQLLGDHNNGIETNNASIMNTKDITLGTNANAILVNGNTAFVSNDGKITVGTESNGIYVNGNITGDVNGDGQIDYDSDSNLRLILTKADFDEDESVDYEKFDYTLTNKGNISTGKSSDRNQNYLIYVNGWSNLYNSGDLSGNIVESEIASVLRITGIYAKYGYVYNKGNIDLPGMVNIGIEGDYVDIINLGNITLGEQSTGIKTNGSRFLVNSGEITLTDDSNGIYVDGSVDNRVGFAYSESVSVNNIDYDFNNDKSIKPTLEDLNDDNVFNNTDLGLFDYSLVNTGRITVGTVPSGVRKQNYLIYVKDYASLYNNALLSVSTPNSITRLTGIYTGSGLINNLGNIYLEGSYSNGIETGTAAVINKGTLALGNYGYGIKINGNTSFVSNSGEITVGDYGNGIWVNGGISGDVDGDGNADYDSNNDGVVSYTLTDINEDGVIDGTDFAKLDYSLTNSRNITVGTASNSGRNYFIYVKDGANVYNTGALSAYSTNSIIKLTGIYTASGTIYNTGAITADGTEIRGIETNTASIFNQGNIILGNKSTGILVNGATDVIINNGNISVGQESDAIRVGGNVQQFENAGEIVINDSLDNNANYGINIGGNVTSFTNTGKITTGDEGNAIYVGGDVDTFTNSSRAIITIGDSLDSNVNYGIRISSAKDSFANSAKIQTGKEGTAISVAGNTGNFSNRGEITFGSKDDTATTYGIYLGGENKTFTNTAPITSEGKGTLIHINGNSGEFKNTGVLTSGALDASKSLINISGDVGKFVNTGALNAGNESNAIYIGGNAHRDTNGDGVVDINDAVVDVNGDGVINRLDYDIIYPADLANAGVEDISEMTPIISYVEGDNSHDRDFNFDSVMNEDDYSFSNTATINIGKSLDISKNQNYAIYVGGFTNMHNTGDILGKPSEVVGANDASATPIVNNITGIHTGSGFIFNDGGNITLAGKDNIGIESGSASVLNKAKITVGDNGKGIVVNGSNSFVYNSGEIVLGDDSNGIWVNGDVTGDVNGDGKIDFDSNGDGELFVGAVDTNNDLSINDGDYTKIDYTLTNSGKITIGTNKDPNHLQKYAIYVNGFANISNTADIEDVESNKASYITGIHSNSGLIYNGNKISLTGNYNKGIHSGSANIYNKGDITLGNFGDAITNSATNYVGLFENSGKIQVGDEGNGIYLTGAVTGDLDGDGIPDYNQNGDTYEFTDEDGQVVEEPLIAYISNASGENGKRENEDRTDFTFVNTGTITIGNSTDNRNEQNYAIYVGGQQKADGTYEKSYIKNTAAITGKPYQTQMGKAEDEIVNHITGIYNNNGAVINSGAITLKGDYNNGIVVPQYDIGSIPDASLSVIINTGAINVRDDSKGIYVPGAPRNSNSPFIRNSGAITVGKGSFGILTEDKDNPHVDNSGAITLGEGSEGIHSATIVNSGNVTGKKYSLNGENSDDKVTGSIGLNGSLVKNTGTITLKGSGNTGIESCNSVDTNNGSITVGKISTGIQSKVLTKNESGGSIVMDSGSSTKASYGIHNINIDGATKIENEASISAKNLDEGDQTMLMTAGIVADTAGENLIENSGAIDLTNSKVSIGIYNSKGKIKNGGKIVIGSGDSSETLTNCVTRDSYSYGIYTADGKGDVENTDSISVSTVDVSNETSGSQAFVIGIRVFKGLISNTGEINLGASKDSVGIYAPETESTVTNSGQITIGSGSSPGPNTKGLTNGISYGIYVGENSGKVTNSGKIAIGKDNKVEQTTGAYIIGIHSKKGDIENTGGIDFKDVNNSIGIESTYNQNQITNGVSEEGDPNGSKIIVGGNSYGIKTLGKKVTNYASIEGGEGSWGIFVNNSEADIFNGKADTETPGGAITVASGYGIQTTGASLNNQGTIAITNQGTGIEMNNPLAELINGTDGKTYAAITLGSGTGILLKSGFGFNNFGAISITGEGIGIQTQNFVNTLTNKGAITLGSGSAIIAENANEVINSGVITISGDGFGIKAPKATQLSNTGTITISGNGSGILAEKTETLTNTVQIKVGGRTTEDNPEVGYGIKAPKAVLTNKAPIEAGSTGIYGKKVTNEATVKTSENNGYAIVAEEQGVTNTGAITSAGGGIWAKKGVVTNSVTIKAGAEYAILANEGNVTNNGSITSDGAGIKADKGAVINNANITSKVGYAILANQGNVTNEGTIKSDAAGIKAVNGDVTNKAKIENGSGYAIEVGTGSVRNESAGEINSSAGGVMVTNGSATNKAKITAGSGFAISAKAGITNEAEIISSGDGLKSDGTITNSGNITINGGGTAIASNSGSNTNSAVITLNGNGIGMTKGTNNGSIQSSADGATGMSDGTNSATGTINLVNGIGMVKGTNSGSITVRGSGGVGMSDGTNNGDISISESAIGMRAGTNSRNITVNSGTGMSAGTNGGTIIVNSGIGMNSGTNGGTIEVNGGSTGMRTGTNGGTITVNSGVGMSNGTNSGTIVVASGSTGMTGGTNSGDIYVTVGHKGDAMTGNVTNNGNILGWEDPDVETQNAPPAPAMFSLRSSQMMSLSADDNSSLADNEETPAPVLFKVAKNNTVLNKGTMSTYEDLDFDEATEAENSEVAVGKSGLFMAKSIKGTVVADSSIVEDGFDTTYVNENSFVGKNEGVNAESGSYMFDATTVTTTADDGETETTAVVMTMKSFDEVVDNQQVAGYLAQNYESENGEEVFKDLKRNRTRLALDRMVNQKLGFAVVPNFNQQNLDVLRNLNSENAADLADLPVDGKTLVKANFYKQSVGSKAGLEGYDDKVKNVYGFKVNKVAENLYAGYGVAASRSDSKYDEGSSRYNNMVEVFAPVAYQTNKYQALLKPYAGFGKGHYRRVTDNDVYKAKTKEYFYGVDANLKANIDLGVAQVVPSAGLEVDGIYSDKVNESNNGLKLKANNFVATRSSVGADVEKDFRLNCKHNLKLTAGGKYYHEFGNRWKNKATIADMNEGYYDLSDNGFEKDYGVVRAKALYSFKNFEFNASVNRILKKKYDTYYMLSIGYKM